MALKTGIKNLAALKLGASNVVKAYLGGNIVFEVTSGFQDFIFIGSNTTGKIYKYDFNLNLVAETAALTTTTFVNNMIVIDRDFIYAGCGDRITRKYAQSDMSLVAESTASSNTIVSLGVTVDLEENILIKYISTPSTSTGFWRVINPHTMANIQTVSQAGNATSLQYVYKHQKFYFSNSKGSGSSNDHGVNVFNPITKTQNRFISVGLIMQGFIVGEKLLGLRRFWGTNTSQYRLVELDENTGSNIRTIFNVGGLNSSTNGTWSWANDKFTKIYRQTKSQGLDTTAQNDFNTVTAISPNLSGYNKDFAVEFVGGFLRIRDLEEPNFAILEEIEPGIAGLSQNLVSVRRWT